MKTIVIAFYKGRGSILDRAIRLWQSIPHRTVGSKYSHCEIVIDETTYSADAIKGKVVRTVRTYSSYNWDMIYLDVDDNSANEMKKFLLSQVDKPYDFIGIFTAQILALKFDDQKAWFCSELCAAALKLCGIDLKHYNSWYNPRRLWDFLSSRNV